MDGENFYNGCDYNPKYVNWCKKNITKVKFEQNNLSPPLKYSNCSFDLIYGISIFTHLSEKMHYEWMSELTRVLKRDGILFITTHGEVHKFKLLKKEESLYNNNELVVHDYKKEGNRLFAAYQPTGFMKKLFKKYKLQVLKHVPGRIINNKIEQDIWIVSPKKLSF